MPEQSRALPQHPPHQLGKPAPPLAGRRGRPGVRTAGGGAGDGRYYRGPEGEVCAPGPQDRRLEAIVRRRAAPVSRPSPRLCVRRRPPAIVQNFDFVELRRSLVWPLMGGPARPAPVYGQRRVRNGHGATPRRGVSIKTRIATIANAQPTAPPPV